MSLLIDHVGSPGSFAPADARDLAPLDLEQLRRRCMGSLDLVERLLASFERRFPPALLKIELYLSANDAPRLIQLAHQLKGAAANISALALHHLLQQMEVAAGEEELAAAAVWLSQLQCEWERFTHYKGSVCSK